MKWVLESAIVSRKKVMSYTKIKDDHGSNGNLGKVSEFELSY